MDISAYGIKQIFKTGPGKKKILGKDGKPIIIKEEYYINELAEYVKPYVLVPRNADLNPTQPEQIISAASSVSPDAQMFMVDEGLFEGAYLTGEFENSSGVIDTTPDALIEIIDSQRKVSITGQPCHVQTIVGTGQEPFVLPESIIIDKLQPLTIRVTDIGGAELRSRIQIHGQRMYSEQVRDPRLDKYVKRRRERNRHMTAYFCPLDQTVSLTGNQQGKEYYFTHDYQTYFEVRKITYVATGAFKFKITDEKNNGMQSDWIHANAALGTALNPFIYYGPWLIKPGGRVTFIFNELSGSTNTIRITLSGRQHFVFPGP